MWLISSLLLWSSGAEAAGYYFTGVGVRGVGRAGAGVVGADDLSAQHYNPAALVNIDGPRLNFQLSGVHQLVSFDRQDETDLAFESVGNTAAPLPIPHLGYARPLGDRFVAAIGFTSPYAPALSFPADGAQRFTLIDSTILSGEVGASIAWRASEQLSVGAGVSWTFLQLDQTLISHVNPAGFQATDDPNYDVLTGIQARDMAQVTGDIGILYDTGRFAVAASFSPPVAFEATGSLTSDFSKNVYYTGEGDLGQVVAESEASDDSVTLPLTLPAIARLGGLWRPTDAVSIEADVVWQGWSSMENLTLTDIDMEIATTLDEPSRVSDDVILPLSMRDAWSVHVAAEGILRPKLVARGGLFFETSAAAEGYASVLLPDGWKVGYGLGGSTALRKGLWLDFGLGQSFAPPNEIINSQVFQIQIDPVTGDVTRGKTVGRGTLWSLGTIL
ncbi:MAG: long-chain fatty acid transport protein, partial [Myxococcota bacterium]